MFTSQVTSLVDYSDSDDSMEVAPEKVRKVNMNLHRYCGCHYMIHKCFTFYLFQTMSRKVDNNTLTYIYHQLDSESDSSGPLYHSDSTIVDETDDPDSLKAHSSEQSYFVPMLKRTKSILVGI